MLHLLLVIDIIRVFLALQFETRNTVKREGKKPEHIKGWLKSGECQSFGENSVFRNLDSSDDGEVSRDK